MIPTYEPTEDPLTILIRARELLSDPKRWTQREAARDSRGVGVPPTNVEARCFRRR